ncbi:MAG: recombination protein NinG [Gammaproteobacteria bacterium]|nr:recombination protein NinG [Gammaproteobacteria bacterium]
MPLRLCTGCKDRYNAETMQKLPAGWFHTFDCAIEYANRRTTRAAKTAVNKVKKEKRAQHKADKERVKPRAKWLAELQALVNQYIVHVRDKDEGCFTCSTANDIKFDAGHYRSVGSCKELRFELTNIHKQCAIQCNMYKSGARAEYRVAIVNKYGQAHLEWLDGPHQLLKDQLPHYLDIKAEIIRYRKILRDNGLKPRC